MGTGRRVCQDPFLPSLLVHRGSWSPNGFVLFARGEEETAACAQVLVGGHREHFSVCAFSRKGRQGSDWDGLMEGEERSGRGSKGVGETEFCSNVRVWAGSALAVAVPCP